MEPDLSSLLRSQGYEGYTCRYYTYDLILTLLKHFTYSYIPSYYYYCLPWESFGFILTAGYYRDGQYSHCKEVKVGQDNSHTSEDVAGRVDQSMNGPPAPV